MVDGLFHPLTIFLLGLGGGFAIPLLYRLGRDWLRAGFVRRSGGSRVVTCVSFVNRAARRAADRSADRRLAPPYRSICGSVCGKGSVALGVDIVAVLGALHLWDRLREIIRALLLYLILMMGISGMVMTRDLFNLFVFLEIVSIATYGLLGLEREARPPWPRHSNTSWRRSLPRRCFLLGSVLLYYATGTLNIDELIARRAELARPDWRIPACCCCWPAWSSS